MKIIKDTIQSKIDFWTRPHLSIESADERRQARLLRGFLLVDDEEMIIDVSKAILEVRDQGLEIIEIQTSSDYLIMILGKG